jgi:hypothetical protein
LFVNETLPVQLSVAVGAVKITTALQLFTADAVIATGVVIIGAIVSFTVTNCVLVTVLPATSVAVHVTTVFPIGKVDGALFVKVTPLQLSEAIGAVNTTVAVHPEPTLAVIATGVVKFGDVTSITVIVCVAVLTLPLASVAVHVTIVLPIGYIPFTGALFVRTTPPQLSNTAGAVKTIAAEQVDPALAVIEAGAAITGATLSVTVTVCVAVVLFP